MIALVLAASMALLQLPPDPGAGFAPPRQGLDPLDAEREARVMRLGKQIRCTVCQGVSIADSPASTARAMLDKVREMVAAGMTDAQIFQYFEDRYGEFALEKPKTEGTTLGLWVLPVLLLLGGLLLVWMQVKKPAPAAASAPPEAEVKPVEDEFLAKVRADLQKPS
ncbi:MAG: cytochrome c-type biogenesis protein CcmH [Myxococcaceae bacterium]